MGITIGVAISTKLRVRDTKYLILMLEICVVTFIVKGHACVLLEIPSMHKLVQYFQSLHRNQDMYELKGVHIANFEIDLLYQMLIVTNVSKQQFMQCVTLL